MGADGSVTTYSAPTLFINGGAQTIAPPPLRTAPPLAAATKAYLTDAAAAANISPDLIEAVAWRESRFRPRVVSSAGAVGEMQLMPATARSLAVDPYDSGQNYKGGANYLAAMMRRYDGDLTRALAAYNAGAGSVDRYGGVPPYKETRAYVAAIMERLATRAGTGTEATAK